jgi:hypothetical protein
MAHLAAQWALVALAATITTKAVVVVVLAVTLVVRLRWLAASAEPPAVAQVPVMRQMAPPVVGMRL